MEDLDLEYLASYHLLIQIGHFGRTAKLLHVTASALTKRIQRLESQMGVELLQRAPGGMFTVTEAGSRLAAKAGPLLDHVREIRREVLADRPDYHLRLAVGGAMGEFPSRETLLELQMRLKQIYPKVRLSCLATPLDQLHSVVLKNQADVAITVDGNRLPALHYSAIGSLTRVCLVSHQHELWDAHTVSIQAVCASPMLFDPRLPSEWMGKFCFDDVRPIRDAQLVEVSVNGGPQLQRRSRSNAAIAITQRGSLQTLIPGIKVLRINGAPPLEMLCVRRQADGREPVSTLVSLLRHVTREGRLE